MLTKLCGVLSLVKVFSMMPFLSSHTSISPLKLTFPHFKKSTVVGIATETSGGLNPILRFSLIFFGSMGIGIAIGVMCAYVNLFLSSHLSQIDP